jgi:hypothetical protein
MAGEQMTDAAKLDAKLDSILGGLKDAADERKADRARMDAAEKERKADREKLDSYCAKSDAAEKERMDAAKADAEKKKEEEEKCRKDAEEKAKADAERATADAAAAKADADAKAKADAAAAATAAEGSELAKLRGEFATLSRLVPAQVTPEVRQRMAGFQRRAHETHLAFGDSAGAPAPMNGESEVDYRIRLLSGFQKHSKVYKDADLSKVAIADVSVFGAIEDSIYSDAMHEAEHPSVITKGVLIPQKIMDGAGRTITKYVGDPNACWDQFNPPIRHVRRIHVPGSARLQ